LGKSRTAGNGESQYVQELKRNSRRSKGRKGERKFEEKRGTSLFSIEQNSFKREQ